MIKSFPYFTSGQFLVYNSYHGPPLNKYDPLSKKIMTLTYSLNALIGHYLDFTEADWSAKLSHDKINLRIL